jgi:hypothetical protein
MSEDSASAWQGRHTELASWAYRHLVVRHDVWGGYYLRTSGDLPEVRTWTKPMEDNRGRVLLTEKIIDRHFRLADVDSIIGLHSTSADNHSLVGTLDVDQHGPGSSTAEVNQAAALSWYVALRGLGFHPLLWSSNGKGGYHLDLILAERIPTHRLYQFMRALSQDHVHHGLGHAPEHFPKQPQIPPGGCGNWSRLVGKHYRHAHWAEVWDGSVWLSGHAAVDHILSLSGDDPNLVPDVPPPPPRRPVRPVWTPAREEGKPVGRFKSLADRVAAYMARMPHRGEGQGRDDLAYKAACYLVRDMKLSDDVALQWLQRWDAGNTPPKGEQALRKCIASAHNYGGALYGSGRIVASLARKRTE